MLLAKVTADYASHIIAIQLFLENQLSF